MTTTIIYRRHKKRKDATHFNDRITGTIDEAVTQTAKTCNTTTHRHEMTTEKGARHK